MDAPFLRSFYEELNEEERASLHERGHRRSAGRSTVLFNEGDPGDHVVVVLSGQVSIGRNSHSGRTVTLAVRGAGEIVGELAALEGTTRSATAVVTTDAELLVVPASAFDQFLDEHPRVRKVLWSMTVAKLREASERQVELVSNDAVGRVCARLVELADHPQPGRHTVELPGGQQELGWWCGLTREATARALASLRKLGWIRTEGRRVHLLELEAIRARGVV